jgi:uncharacterized membrane protein YfcA
MTILTIILLAFIGIAVGISIGCIGIGGVVLVPILVQFVGMPVHQAIPIAMAGYVMTGVVGTWTFARMRTIDWSLTRWLWTAAMPGAIAGSIAVKAMPSSALKVTIAVMTAMCGVRTLLHTRQYIGSTKFAFRPGTSLAVGAITGFVSALTGTGGPVVLIPILIWLEAPVMIAIGLAQAIQLPIASLATLSYVTIGALNPLPGIVLGFGLSTGAFVGARLAHGLDQGLLRKAVALILVGSAVFLILGAFSEHLGSRSGIAP